MTDTPHTTNLKVLWYSSFIWLGGMDAINAFEGDTDMLFHAHWPLIFFAILLPILGIIQLRRLINVG